MEKRRYHGSDKVFPTEEQDFISQECWLKTEYNCLISQLPVAVGQATSSPKPPPKKTKNKKPHNQKVKKKLRNYMSEEGFEKLQHILKSLEGHAHIGGYVHA